MSLARTLLAVLAAVTLAAPAAAQVEVTPLAAPDYFSLGLRNTGMQADLWTRTSPEVARQIIPRLGRKPLSPAAADLARKLLGAGVYGPEGAGRDPDLAAARIQALLALGAPRAAWAAAERAPGTGGNANLAQAVAEAALLEDQDDDACRVAEGLTVGRGEVFWLRLRAFCQTGAGERDAAQLTMTLAAEKARDPVYARLMGAMIAGAGDPGAASLRNPLEYALSRRLALDLEAARATASPVVAQALWPTPITPESEAVAVARSLIASSRQNAGIIDSLLAEAEAAPAKAKPALYGRIQILAAMGGQLSPTARGKLAVADAGKSTAAPNLLLALDLASASGLKGETALLALAVCNDAGPAGPPPADRHRIIEALRTTGFAEAAEAFAVEGLTGS